MISVVVPVRDGLPWMEEQLRALVEQESAEPWEIVVADNGSTDQSLAVARRWAETEPRIRVVDASRALGPGAARNVGVRAARGELLAFCDADDVVQPGWLSAFAEALAGADVAGGVFDNWSLNGFTAPSPGAAEPPPAMRQFSFLEAGLSSNLAVRRNAFEDVGGFAEELLVGEDTDLCWRLQLHGYRFVIADRALIARRDRRGFREVFRRYMAYGRCGPVLYARHRASGMRSETATAMKSWAWIVLNAPGVVSSRRRVRWAELAAWRTGRLVESIRLRVLFL
jgi:glycosyltransferase involved in cell wall biosynthesis